MGRKVTADAFFHASPGPGPVVKRSVNVSRLVLVGRQDISEGPIFHSVQF